MSPQATSTIAVRVDELERRTDTSTRTRVRNVLQGGQLALTELLGPTKASAIGLDMPAANLLYSGMERLAQKLRHPPTLKVDPVGRNRNDDAARARADKLEAIVRGHDHAQHLEAQLGWNGRWLPVYSVGAWTMTLDRHGTPIAHIVDPFDLYPGGYGPNNDPSDMAVIRKIRVDQLKALYPLSATRIPGKPEDRIKVAEYYSEAGVTVVAHEIDVVLHQIPNPVEDELPFVFMTVPGVTDTPQGQYDQALGLLKDIIEINVDTLIAIHDDVHAPYFIIGELLSGPLQRGRFGNNEVSQGGAVQRGTQSNVFPAQNQTSVLDRQLRTVVGYPNIDDTVSPTSFATGAGMEELRSDGVDNIVDEYRDITARAVAAVDTLRLQWDEQLYPDEERTLMTSVEGESRVLTYTPGADINGAVMTRREFGPMVGWGDTTKILAGGSLLDRGAIDLQTYQEGIHRIPAINRMNERNRSDEMEQGQKAILVNDAQNGNPAAEQAMNEIRNRPQDFGKILDTYFEQKAAAAQQALQAQQAQAAAAGAGAPGPGGAPSVGGALARAAAQGAPPQGAPAEGVPVG